MPREGSHYAHAHVMTAPKYVPDDSPKGVTIALVHDNGQVGESWSQFMEEMFTVDLPENYRDMGLDIRPESLENLDDGSTLENIKSCMWKLFLFSHSMLKELKNKESSLAKSDLFESTPEQIVVLILAEQEDQTFHDDVRRLLCVFPDFSSFHLVSATSREKIFSDIISIVSPLYIVFHPNILSSEDKEQHITLIANKSYPTADGLKFIVAFDYSSSTKEVDANLFNCCTLLLQNPGLPAGMIDVKVFACPSSESEEDNEDNADSRYQLGEVMKVWVQSDLDKVDSILEKSNNPFNFLCQALKIDPSNPDALDLVDKQLTDSFSKHVPENQLRVFGTHQGVDADGSEGKSREFAPTLLHFAAAHGLRTLTALLLRCPGAVRAFGTANCDGDYPTNLAEKSGHWDLQNYMKSYMEVSAMVDYEAGGVQNTSQMMAQMVTGHFVAVNESVYDTNNGAAGTLPGYLQMKPLAAEVPEASYDRPFIVAIPSADDTPNYESILAQMIDADEETYMTFGEQEFEPLSNIYGPTSRQNDIPLPPPRDHLPPALSAPAPPNENPPPLPPDRSGEQPVKPAGADRVSYQALDIPKLHSYTSPAQRELINLQQKVKNGELTTNQAVIRFKEWERKHKEQAASFQFQQECLQRVRNSLMKSKELKRSRGEDDSLEITTPILAGSSTYDQVLRKTTQSDPKEVLYGSSKKPPKLDDGFRRSSSIDSIGRPQNIYTKETFPERASIRSSISSANFEPPAPPVPALRARPPVMNSSPSYGTVIRRGNERRAPPPVPPRDDGGGNAPFVPPRPHQW